MTYALSWTPRYRKISLKRIPSLLQTLINKKKSDALNCRETSSIMKKYMVWLALTEKQVGGDVVMMTMTMMTTLTTIVRMIRRRSRISMTIIMTLKMATTTTIWFFYLEITSHWFDIPVAFLASRGAWRRRYQSLLQLCFEIKIWTEFLPQWVKTTLQLWNHWINPSLSSKWWTYSSKNIQNQQIIDYKPKRACT